MRGASGASGLAIWLPGRSAAGDGTHVVPSPADRAQRAIPGSAARVASVVGGRVA